MLIQNPNIIFILLVVILGLFGISGGLFFISRYFFLKEKIKIRIKKLFKVTTIVGASIFAFLILDGISYYIFS